MDGRTPTWRRRDVDARSGSFAGRDPHHRPRSGRWRSGVRTTTFGDFSGDNVTRILIADDHALLRSGLRALFESMEGIEVVGEAANGNEAVELAAQLERDMVIVA